MKKLLLLGLAIVLFTSCEPKDSRYTQQSPEIETVKTLIDNYNKKAYDTSIYADSSKTFYNSKDKGLTPSETMEYHKANDALYSSRTFLEEGTEYEMVTTDDGETWVNCWLDWKGTLAGNNKDYIVPIHLTYRFIDKKIVREVGMWDPTEIVLAAQEIEAANNSPASEQKINSNINTFIDSFLNKQDASVLDNILADNYVRYLNGNKVSSSASELAPSLQVFFDGFPDFHINLTKRFIQGNEVFVNWTMTGTNTEAFNGVAATGKKVEVSGLSRLVFNGDGKMTFEEVHFNELKLLEQLGYSVAPPQ